MATTTWILCSHGVKKKQGITWGTKLYEKLIEATHLLWTKHNSFEDDRKLHRLIEVEDIHLKTAIKFNVRKEPQDVKD